MIEIKCENELIQFDIVEFVTGKKKWGSGDVVKCNVYFTKFECKFTSKDIVISYDAFNQFHTDLTQLLNNEKDHCLLSDQQGVVSLKIHKNKDGFPSLRENEDFDRLIEFEFFYYAGSDMSFKGFLFVDTDSLRSFEKEIELLL
ncbi:hypothetical protein [Commensalibacter oyaizuii]|uniref:Uncharacterized protein n=1 Tax=Commensalibacter oyaizuii TaxID=3043873 RepID=A0ABT6Q2W6_9PROT|nr:hypothetical protein [Commensalibacter sp. TBRC 16381]MDI2091440.1 hypothetical protein [Commensalibacter sp. TBRC 16381]